MTGAVCGACGCSLFERMEGGDYTERHFLDAGTEHQWTEGIDQDRMHVSPWRCWQCQKVATDVLSEVLGDLQEWAVWR